MVQESKQKVEGEYFIDNILRQELDKIKLAVTKKDRDYVMVIDGEEGSGKSVLAMQIAKYLDPDFNLDKLVFNSNQFIDSIKKVKRHSCVILDEAYNASNARASLSEVNRSMVAVATEMRQRNLFVIFVLPTFFDLDKYFALWRCRALIHVYFNKKGRRGKYIIFPKTHKKLLYLNGKKKYDYSKPQSPYPPCDFTNHYVLNEEEYREKKSQAFKKRVVSNQARKWFLQRNAYIKYIYSTLGMAQEDVSKIPQNYGVACINQRQISTILNELHEE